MIFKPPLLLRCWQTNHWMPRLRSLVAMRAAMAWTSASERMPFTSVFPLLNSRTVARGLRNRHNRPVFFLQHKRQTEGERKRETERERKRETEREREREYTKHDSQRSIAKTTHTTNRGLYSMLCSSLARAGRSSAHLRSTVAATLVTTGSRVVTSPQSSSSLAADGCVPLTCRTRGREQNSSKRKKPNIRIGEK